ncbi:hypothetical protein KHQ82_09425 [Mycoplasmatota bacterium]|nr:hypothetical protein KHQ82_09425 [Mycoplasmatota bacterium]
MKENYIVSSTTRICTIIGLIINAASVMGMIFIIYWYQKFFDLLVEELNSLPRVSISQFIEYSDSIKVIIIVLTILNTLFLVINLILFSKLINKKVTLKAAKRITVYQIVYGVITLTGSTISAILYLISGINSNTNLNPVITNPIVEEY